MSKVSFSEFTDEVRREGGKKGRGDEEKKRRRGIKDTITLLGFQLRLEFTVTIKHHQKRKKRIAQRGFLIIH